MKSHATLALLAALAAHPTLAAESVDHAAHHETADAPLTQGEIRKIDRDTHKLTIRHGPIVNLDMQAMTMVFQVEDAALLDRLNVGEKVRFAARRKDGALVVTRVEPDR